MKKEAAPRPEAQATAALSAGLRRYLYATACASGAAIMIVEILGARMLSPYVGTSHFVWTAQITVTLVALACGYYAGGRLVDSSPKLGRLYWAILIAALYLALTVALHEWVVYRFIRLPLAAASLLSSVFLFFAPLCLLAMTAPFLARMVTISVSRVGGTVGRLTAVSTVGSVLGTVAVAYFLIPLLPNSVTMYGTAAFLMAAAVVYFLAWGRRAATAAAAAAVAVAGLTAGYLGLRAEGLKVAGLQELYRGNSAFGMLQVVQVRNRPYRLLLDDYLIQNTYDVERKNSLHMFSYMEYMLARAYAPRLDRVLCIGMGIGLAPRELARGGAAVDVVEINPAVVPLAQRYFDLDPRVFNLTIGDGRTYVRRSRAQYDAVILDAFVGDSIPSHLMTREAFADLRRVLKPDGVLIVDTFAPYGITRDFFAASLSRTLASVFAGVRVHGARDSNTFFVASPRPGLSILHPPDYDAVHREALAKVREAFESAWEPDPAYGQVLTDDYNPVEFYDAANRERFRRMLALSMK